MKAAARLLLLATLFTSVSALAQAAPETKEQKIRRLLALMNAGDVGVQMIGTMIESFRKISPSIPEEVWSGIRKKVSGDDFVTMLIPVYARNLEEADVEALLAFYSSPAGQRFLAKQSTIIQESAAAGREWGAKLGMEIDQEIRKQRQQQ